jgi:hypothetical protein
MYSRWKRSRTRPQTQGPELHARGERTKCSAMNTSNLFFSARSSRALITDLVGPFMGRGTTTWELQDGNADH